MSGRNASPDFILKGPQLEIFFSSTSSPVTRNPHTPQDRKARHLNLFLSYSMDQAHSHSILSLSLWRWKNILLNFAKKAEKHTKHILGCPPHYLYKHVGQYRNQGIHLISVSKPNIQFHDHSWITHHCLSTSSFQVL